MLFAAKDPCNRCNGKISWDKRKREELNTRLPVNLDGTIHDRDFCQHRLEENEISEHLDEVAESTASPRLQEYDRVKEIQQAHKENMEASDNLKMAILELGDKLTRINSTIETLSIIAKTYFQSKLEQEQREEGK
jgi:hypothetical protein